MRAAVAVLVFARAPSPGRAKTRLVPRLGEWGAARLQARLTARALRTAQAARVGPVRLYATPSARHAYFRRLAAECGVRVFAQRGRDLGERMLNALRATLRRHRGAVLIGTDCPALAPADLRRAARALRGGYDAVFSPAEDGGYGLVGMRRPCAEAFDRVDWGTSSVMAQTEDRLARGRRRWRRLRMVWDVDRVEDLARLAQATRWRASPPLRR